MFDNPTEETSRLAHEMTTRSSAKVAALLSMSSWFLDYREDVKALELIELGGEILSETRRGKSTRQFVVGLLRQSLFGRFVGYET